MMRLLIVLFFFLNQMVNAQDDWRIYGDAAQDTSIEYYDQNNTDLRSSPVEGNIVIIADPAIDTLVSTLNENPPATKGYRVEIFFGQRKEAEKVKSQFLKQFDQWPIYVVWQQPNFKVQIGNFNTKLEAEKTQQEIKSSYPSSYITITEIKQAEY